MRHMMPIAVLAISLVGRDIRGQVVPAHYQLSYGDDASVLKDDGSGPYSLLHWWDVDADGKADSPGEHHFPVSYIRNVDQVTVSSVTFVVPSTWVMSPPLTGTLTSIGPDNDALTKQVTINGSLLTATDMTSPDPLPNTVKFYRPYIIGWSLSFQNMTQEQAQALGYSSADAIGPQLLGNTDNRMYVMGASNTPGLFETVGERTCEAANNESSLDRIRDTIWSGVFSDNNQGPANPKRKDKNGYNFDDGAALVYYGGVNAINVADLMFSGSGICNAWQDFLDVSFSLHGVQGEKKTVNAVFPYNFLLVNNWELRSGAQPQQINPTLYAYADLNNLQGAEGQGNEEPPAFFSIHCINLVDEEIFDPSYGTRKPSLKKWEKAALFCVGSEPGGVGPPPFTPTGLVRIRQDGEQLTTAM